jgi:hypothetical protein
MDGYSFRGAHLDDAIRASLRRAARYYRNSGRSQRVQRLESRRDAEELGRRIITFRPSRRTMALVAAGSAATAGALAVAQAGRLRHDRVLGEYEVCRLNDLRSDPDALELIQRELQSEWGPFAPADMEEMELLVKKAGHLTFVIRFRLEDGSLSEPAGVLQTALADVGGDPSRLGETFGSFLDITSNGVWTEAPRMKGDTALLLQITAFGERSRGVGSRLRDAALYMLPRGVRFALTMTPVDDGFRMGVDPEDYPPAVKFHYHGGARLAGYAADFKRPPEGLEGHEGRQKNGNVAFLRYTRLPSGDWDGVERPDAVERRLLSLAGVSSLLHLPYAS